MHFSFDGLPPTSLDSPAGRTWKQKMTEFFSSLPKTESGPIGVEVVFYGCPTDEAYRRGTVLERAMRLYGVYHPEAHQIFFSTLALTGEKKTEVQISRFVFRTPR